MGEVLVFLTMWTTEMEKGRGGEKWSRGIRGTSRSQQRTAGEKGNKKGDMV